VRLGTVLGPRTQPKVDEDVLRDARLAAARGNRRWREIQVPVARGPGFRVDVESDEIFTVRRGEVFVTASANFAGTQDANLAFYVRNGWPVVLEPYGKTWSDVVARREQRLRAAR